MVKDIVNVPKPLVDENLVEANKKFETQYPNFRTRKWSSPRDMAKALYDDVSNYDKSKYLVKEISKKYGPDFYNYWDDDRIKGAFNFGNGTWKDMKRYMDDNKEFAKFEIIRGE